MPIDGSSNMLKLLVAKIESGSNEKLMKYILEKTVDMSDHEFLSFSLRSLSYEN